MTYCIRQLKRSRIPTLRHTMAQEIKHLWFWVHAPTSAQQLRLCQGGCALHPALLLQHSSPQGFVEASFKQLSFNYKPHWIITQFLLIKPIWLFGMIHIGHMMSVLMRDECTSTFDMNIHPMAFELQIFMCNYDIDLFKRLFQKEWL